MDKKNIGKARTLNKATDETTGWELLRHEYTEAAANFRHFSALRFAIMTVYVGVVGGLGAVALGLVQSATPYASLWSARSAVLVTVAFFVTECVCERNRQHYFSCLQSLELPLGYSTTSSHPQWKFVQARYAIAILYLGSLAFWTHTAFRLWQ